MTSSKFLDDLIRQEIRRFVEKASWTSDTLRVSEVVEAIKQTYPSIPVAERDLENMIITAASRSQVGVEMGWA